MNSVQVSTPIPSTQPLVVQEEREWSSFMDELTGDGQWQLIDVSRTNTDQRVFRVRDRVLKVLRNRDEESAQSGLAHEAAILNQLSQNGMSQYRAVTYQRVGGWEVLDMPKFTGHRLDEAWRSATFQQRIKVGGRLLAAVARVNRAGVSHRDLRSANILVGQDQSVTLLDFGQARNMSWPASFLNDSVGLPGSAAGPEVTLTKALTKVGAPWLSKPVASARRLVAGNRKHKKSHQPAPISIGTARQDSEVARLTNAWKLGSASDATAEGEAYYSLNIAGTHLPGERPWPLRWEMIQRSVSFKNKHYVELGCNLGLLSSHALLHGAAAARGVDINPIVVEGAREVAKTWMVEPEFAVLNVDSPEPWEEAYSGADIASALSLYNWIEQKDRLLNFLARHKEALYEGHDSLEIETNRLRGCGFKTVTILGETERNRWLLYATK